MCGSKRYSVTIFFAVFVVMSLSYGIGHAQGLGIQSLMSRTPFSLLPSMDSELWVGYAGTGSGLLVTLAPKAGTTPRGEISGIEYRFPMTGLVLGGSTEIPLPYRDMSIIMEGTYYLGGAGVAGEAMARTAGNNGTGRDWSTAVRAAWGSRGYISRGVFDGFRVLAGLDYSTLDLKLSDPEYRNNTFLVHNDNESLYELWTVVPFIGIGLNMRGLTIKALYSPVAFGEAKAKESLSAWGTIPLPPPFPPLTVITLPNVGTIKSIPGRGTTFAELDVRYRADIYSDVGLGIIAKATVLRSRDETDWSIEPGFNPPPLPNRGGMSIPVETTLEHKRWMVGAFVNIGL
jgi:hypothetical protein